MICIPRETVRGRESGRYPIRSRMVARSTALRAAGLGHLGLVQHSPGLLEHRGARIGQRNAPLRAVEEPDSELLLELADLLADGWLCHVQPLGGPAKMEFLSDGYEVPQMAKFHGTMVPYAGALVIGPRAALFVASAA